MDVSLYYKGNYEEFHAREEQKNKANQSQHKRNEVFFTCDARDYHGTSGLAITSITLLLCALVALWLLVNRSKQSQFGTRQRTIDRTSGGR